MKQSLTRRNKDISNTRDGQDSVTVKFGKTGDGHIRDVAVTGPGQIREGSILI